MQDGEREDRLTVVEILRILRRWVWVIVLVAFVCLGTGLGYSVAQTPWYEASCLVLIRGAQVDDPTGDAQAIQFEVEGLKAITPTMARAAVSRPVVAAAINRLELPTTPEDLTTRLQAEPVADTQFISITYEDSSPQRAQRVVDTIGEVLSEQLPVLNPINTPIDAVVWERAVLPKEPTSPNISINVGLALATGTILGVLSAFMLEGLSNAGVFRRRYRKRHSKR